MAEQHKAMKSRYENRKNSILKKSKELSTLCDVKVCMIVVSPDGKLETWPNNLNDVKAVLSAVKGSSKPIRCENLRIKKGRGGRLCSRIKIPKKAVKGKEIEQENCNFRNVVDEVFCDVSGTYQENKDVYNKFGMGIPGPPPAMGLVDMTVNQAPSSLQYPKTHYYNQGNGNYCGKYMVTNLDYACGSGSMNPETNNNINMLLLPNQEHSGCGRYHHEMGSSSGSAFNSGLNFSNQEPPTPSLAYGNSSSAALNSGINNFCNMVHPIQEYQQYENGSSSSLAYQQYGEEIGISSSLSYLQYEIGIWE